VQLCRRQGPIELSLLSVPNYEGRVGLGETVKGLEAIAENAGSNPQAWLTEMIEVGRANASLTKQDSQRTFLDPMISIFQQRKTRYAHPEVREKVRDDMEKWECARLWEAWRKGDGTQGRLGKN
jgi:hypothetical protein